MPSDALYLALSQALSRPSKAYQAAQAGLAIPQQLLQGYLEGGQVADIIRKRKEAQQTLGEALGGNVPESIASYSNVPQETFTALAPSIAALSKANKPDNTVNFLLPDQAKAAGVSPEVIQSFAGKPIPRQIAQMDVSRQIGQTRNENMAGMVDARKASVQNAVLNTALRYSQAGMVQSAAKDSFGRLANINRAQQLLDQIQNQGGAATIRQRTELASAVGRSINPTGVLTNEALNLYIPNTLKGKFGNFSEYLSNESTPVDFTGFTGELGGLLQREKEVNQGLIQSASQFGQPAIEQLNKVNPSLAKSVQGANQNSLVFDSSGTTHEFRTEQEANASGYKGLAKVAGRKAIIH